MLAPGTTRLLSSAAAAACDPLRFTGSVTGKSEGSYGEGLIEVAFKGSNSLGDHVSGTATISLLDDRVET